MSTYSVAAEREDAPQGVAPARVSKRMVDDVTTYRARRSGRADVVFTVFPGQAHWRAWAATLEAATR